MTLLQQLLKNAEAASEMIAPAVAQSNPAPAKLLQPATWKGAPLPNVPSQGMPYIGQRHTEEELLSKGVSPEEFFGGGGRLMFTDSAKPQAKAPQQVAPVPAPAPVNPQAIQTPKFQGKTAPAVQQAPKVKKMAADNALVWEGLLAQLVKEGANEDFIAGMLKEAESPEWLGKAMASFGPAADKIKHLLGELNPEDSSGLHIDRNRIVPAMSNRLLGGLGGALAGGIAAHQLALDKGMGKYLMPLAGGLAAGGYLPGFMNHWKDAHGEGLNSINSGVADFNKANPLSTPEKPSYHGQSVFTPNNLSSAQPSA